MGPVSASSTELLEREASLASLAGWLADVPRSGGCVVAISGEAGLGKSSLVRRFVAEQRGLRVLLGACDALFAPHPLAPLRDVARVTGGALLAALAVGSPREQVFAAALDELDGTTTTILVVEDVHWADDATLDLLKHVGRRIAQLNAMLLLTYRDDAVDARHPLRFVLGDLSRDVLHRIELAPLSPAAVAALARDVGRSDRGLHAATGGNPFFVTEALAAGSGSIPASIRDAVLARLSGLPLAARELADVVSIVPGRTEAQLLHDLGLDDPVALEACARAGMVVTDDGSLAFRHEYARRAVEDSLTPVRRRELHSRVLASLVARRGVAAARLVHHADGAGDADAVRLHAPLAAAQAAALGAHREAAKHYGAALRHAERVDARERAELLDRLGYEHYLTDDSAAGHAARVEALALWRSVGDRVREGDCLRWLSRLEWFLGRKQDADRHAAEAVATLEPLGATRELAMAYSNRSQLHMLAAENAEAIDWGRRAVELAERFGDDEVLSHALNNVGTALFGESGEGFDELDRSLRIALDRGYGEHAARAFTNLSTSAIARRDYPIARRYLDEGIRYCESRDHDAWTNYMRAWRARMRFELADWDGALDDAQWVLERGGHAVVHRIPALVAIGRVYARRGDPRAVATLDEALVLARATAEPQRVCPAAAGRAELAWLQGDADLAARVASEALPLTERHRNPWPRAELAYWVHAAGGASVAPAPSPGAATPFTMQVKGDAAAAIAEWERLGCPYEAAVARAECDDEASLRAALAALESLGAEPMAAIVRRRLHARGVRGLARGARASTRANPHGLTSRELQVLALVEGGLRNPAIARRLSLSPKTVEHHVGAILGKLGVATRGEAAAAARRLGIEFPQTGGRPTAR
jgi:DNA-binding CsgD family transcriptional regulator/tetratricopeptide (TPR) repeat protein